MASQVDSFWTTSGRIDAFAFEKVAPYDLNKHLGWIEGVTDGSLTFGYNTDLKVSGSLNIVYHERISSCIVRVHYKPRLGTEQKDEVLCTCIASADGMTFDKGVYNGSLELKSMLQQYIGDKLRTGFTIGKNKSYKAEMKRLIKGIGGGTYGFGSGVDDKKCLKATAFEVGRSPMEVIQSIADSLGGQVGVNANGKMVINKYKTPGKKTCTLKLPKGSYSVIKSPVEISDNVNTAVNRVAYRCTVSWKQVEYVLDKKGNRVKYTSGANKGKYKTKTVNKSRDIIGRAQVNTSSPLHRNKTGTWRSEIYDCKKDIGTKKLGTTAELNKKLAEIQAEMNAKAATKLSNVAYRQTYYVIECSYLPVEIGQVVEFERTQSGLNLHVQAMITDIDLTMGKAQASMKIKLRHVRNV